MRIKSAEVRATVPAELEAWAEALARGRITPCEFARMDVFSTLAENAFMHLVQAYLEKTGKQLFLHIDVVTNTPVWEVE
jgi:hypothetical protein